MKIKSYFYKKYGSDVILPPPFEEVTKLEIPSNSKLPEIEEVDLEKLKKKFDLAAEIRKLQKQQKENEKVLSDPENAPATIQATLNTIYKKYAVILPPPPDEPQSSHEFLGNKEKLSPFLSQFILEEGEDALDPSKFEEFEPEITKHRRHDILPEAVFEDLDLVKQQAEEDAKKHEYKKLPSDMPTVPPKGKRASFNKLIKLCEVFAKLSEK